MIRECSSAEFVSSGAAIVRAFGERPPERLLRCSDGQVHVSDDTQMTLFTAEGLTIAPTLDAVHAAYQRWLYTQDPTRFDPRVARPETRA